MPKKISENDWPTTARMPRRRIACGACSRDEPQPKLRVHEHARVAPAYAGFETGWLPPRGLGFAAIVLEQVLLEPLERDGLQEARRDDAIGVDVVAAHRQRACRGSRGCVQRPRAISAAANSRTSTTSPATAAAATIAGLISSVRPGRTALPSLEVAVRRRRADLAPFEPVGVHRQAHRAAGAAPFEAGVAEHAVEPFAFGRGAHRLRARARPAPSRAARRAGRGRCARPRADPRAARSCRSRRTPRRSACPSSAAPARKPMNASALAGSRVIGRAAARRRRPTARD